MSNTWKLPPYTWGEERELCKRCVHYRERIAGTKHSGKTVVMRCALNRKSAANMDHGSCIDMRYDGKCGRLGALFQERQT